MAGGGANQGGAKFSGQGNKGGEGQNLNTQLYGGMQIFKLYFLHH